MKRTTLAMLTLAMTAMAVPGRAHHSFAATYDESKFERLEAELATMAAHVAAGMGRWLTLVAEFDRRRGYEVWECRSTAHWLGWRCGIGLPAARERLSDAELDDELTVREAWALENDRVKVRIEVRLPDQSYRSFTRVAAGESAEDVNMAEYAEASARREVNQLITESVMGKTGSPAGSSSSLARC